MRRRKHGKQAKYALRHSAEQAKLEEEDGRDAQTAAAKLIWLEDRPQRIGLDWNSYLETGELALCCMFVVLTVYTARGQGYQLECFRHDVREAGTRIFKLYRSSNHWAKLGRENCPHRLFVCFRGANNKFQAIMSKSGDNSTLKIVSLRLRALLQR